MRRGNASRVRAQTVRRARGERFREKTDVITAPQRRRLIVLESNEKRHGALSSDSMHEMRTKVDRTN